MSNRRNCKAYRLKNALQKEHGFVRCGFADIQFVQRLCIASSSGVQPYGAIHRALRLLCQCLGPMFHLKTYTAAGQIDLNPLQNCVGIHFLNCELNLVSAEQNKPRQLQTSYGALSALNGTPLTSPGSKCSPLTFCAGFLQIPIWHL